MKIEIYGRIPKKPVAEVFIEETSEIDAKRIVGGIPRLFPIIGDFAVRLDTSELDRLYDQPDVVIEDMRGMTTSVGGIALVQEVSVVQ